MLRPQHFGKSTFAQMLKCFSRISYNDIYDEIFNRKSIYTKIIPGYNTYLVTDFDIFGVSGIRNIPWWEVLLLQLKVG